MLHCWRRKGLVVVRQSDKGAVKGIKVYASGSSHLWSNGSHQVSVFRVDVDHLPKYRSTRITVYCLCITILTSGLYTLISFTYVLY